MIEAVATGDRVASGRTSASVPGYVTSQRIEALFPGDRTTAFFLAQAIGQMEAPDFVPAPSGHAAAAYERADAMAGVAITLELPGARLSA